MAATSLQDLYFNKLQTMLDCERQIVQALPQLAQRAHSDQLRSALQKHLDETRGHVERLQSLCKDKPGQRGQHMECRSMQALIQEAQTTLSNVQDSNVVDACIIASAQAVEHHEMAAYGTACAWAKQLGMHHDADTLHKTLDEEDNADKTLTQIAERSVNQQASSRSSDRQVGLSSGGQADRMHRENTGTGRSVPGAVDRGAEGR